MQLLDMKSYLIFDHITIEKKEESIAFPLGRCCRYLVEENIFFMFLSNFIECFEDHPSENRSEFATHVFKINIYNGLGLY